MQGAGKAVARGTVMGALVGGSVFSPQLAGVAHAVDQGNWASGCAAYPAYRGGCMVLILEAVSSSQKDEDFSNDQLGYQGLNDRVQFVQNRFSTIEIQAFRNKGYSNGSLGTTSCVPVATSFGPYDASGADKGLSSFKTSCA